MTDTIIGAFIGLGGAIIGAIIAGPDRTGTNASDIVKAAIDRHEIAMIKFKPFLCKAEIDAYEKAWKDYAGDSKHFTVFPDYQTLSKTTAETWNPMV